MLNMDNVEYHQNVHGEPTVNMPGLGSAMDHTTSSAIATNNGVPYSLQELLEHEGLMINGEFFSYELLDVEHSPPQHQSPIHWLDTITLAGLCFLPSPPLGAQQHQQSQHHVPPPQQHQQHGQKPQYVQHNQQMQPNHYPHFQSHRQQQPSHQQPSHQQQHQQQQHHQQAPLHYVSSPQNQIMYQQQQQRQHQQQRLHAEKDLGSPAMCSSPPMSPSQVFSPPPSMLSLSFHPNKSLLNRPMMPVTPLSLDFSAYRSVSLDRVSSPEAPSPISDQGFYDMTTDDETASCYSPIMMPGNMHAATNNSNINNNRGDMVAIEHLNISGTSPSPRRRRTPPSLVQKPVQSLEQIILYSPNATAALAAGSATTMVSRTVPSLPSPLKQYFSCSASSDSDCRENKNGSAAAKKKRERKPSKTSTVRPKNPPVRLPCHFPGCTTTCSSQPSLARHAEAHKWRGVYAPVRCEACQSALSNEFSVQRHIVRSQPTSRCRRLRVYSIMMSETEIETSVRFYPKRPHGKKTVVIDLAYARARYLANGL